MRDHYRAWRINNKNNRRAIRQAPQRTVTTAPRESRARPDEVFLAPPDQDPLSTFFRHDEDAIHLYSPNTACIFIEVDVQSLCRDETQLMYWTTMVMNLQNPLRLTGEVLFLHTTLKGLQSWPDGCYELESRPKDILSHANEFHDYLWDMKNAIRLLEAERMCSQTFVKRLSQAGVKLMDCLQRSCNPLTVLMSLQPVIEFRRDKRSNDVPWGEVASQFLLLSAADSKEYVWPFASSADAVATTDLRQMQSRGNG